MSQTGRSAMITGATGLVGSFLVERLLRHGWTVYCLARPRGSISPHERVFAAVYTVNRGFPRERLRVVSGDVTKVDAGLSERDLTQLSGAVEELWHCAALTSFDDRYRDDIWTTNVDGTDNMIRLAKRLRVRAFHFASTAYVADRSDPVAAEELIASRSDFSNVYEESKSASEHRLASSDLRSVTYRLPVMTGRQSDGVTRQYLGFYVFARLFQRLRNKISTILQDHLAGQKLIAEGIRFEKTGGGETILSQHGLHLPVHVRCKPEAHLNLLPIDIVVETMMQCAAARPIASTIVHVTNGAPPTLGDLFRLALGNLGIEGFHLGIEPARSGIHSQLIDAYDRIIHSHTALYTPYLFGEPRFSRDKLARLIGTGKLPDFTCTADYVRRILEYAIATGWKLTC